MSVLLAALCVAAIALAVVAFVRGRDATLFGRPLHRPRMWGIGVICLGVSGLVRLALIEELVPAGWKPATGVAYIGLSAAFVAVLVSHLVLQIRAHG